MSWIQTYSGLDFDLLNPDINKIELIDIVHSLSMQCRFNGHCKEFYSVLEHSIHVSDLVAQHVSDSEIILKALLHDASEAYLCDIPSPIKPLLLGYSTIERSIQNLIYDKFSLSHDMEDIIHDADLMALTIEKKHVMSETNHEWNIPSHKYLYDEFVPRYLSPLQAKEEFIKHFIKITSVEKVSS
jgi:uncharacterized protein